MWKLDGRTVLVTGASGGIGGATVRHLVRAGADVIASGRSGQALEALAAETGCRVAPFDLTSEESVRAALEGLDLWGVVNCGGFGGEIATPMDTDIAVFDKVIIDQCARRPARHQIRGEVDDPPRQGRLYRQRVEPGRARRAARTYILRRVEGGVGEHYERLGARTRQVWHPRQRVNPTVVMTAMSAWYWGRPEIGGPFLRRMPLGRWATVDDVAAPIVFLLSDAASMITGVSLPIDGGYSCC